MGVHSRKDFLAGGIEGENGRTGDGETDAGDARDIRSGPRGDGCETAEAARGN
jgi:hypothetical protein